MWGNREGLPVSISLAGSSPLPLYLGSRGHRVLWSPPEHIRFISESEWNKRGLQMRSDFGQVTESWPRTSDLQD